MTKEAGKKTRGYTVSGFPHTNGRQRQTTAIVEKRGGKGREKT